VAKSVTLGRRMQVVKQLASSPPSPSTLACRLLLPPCLSGTLSPGVGWLLSHASRCTKHKPGVAQHSIVILQVIL
jgi:hypothetical protein